MPVATIPPKTIDEFLGPGEGRYFGEGFKRVTHQMTDMTVGEADGQPVVRAHASLGYPSDWSRKDSGPLRPHLSTIDALVLAVQLSEAYLVHVYGLNEERRRRMWLRRVEVVGGHTPQENLIDVPAEATHMGLMPLPADDSLAVSTFRCSVGTLGVLCAVEHQRGLTQRVSGRYATAETVLGPGVNRLYGDAYRQRRHELDDVRVKPNHESVAASLTVSTDGPAAGPHNGVEGDYQPALAMTDCVVTLAQLAQVLAYTIDQIDRMNSGTLWMRRVTVTNNTAPGPLVGKLAAKVAVERSLRIPFGGSWWRTLVLSGTCATMECRAAIAHRLPGDALPAWRQG